MNIESMQPIKEIADIKIGECFIACDRYYIKTKVVIDNAHRFYAVNLCTGDVEEFTSQTQVRPIKAKVVIEY